MTHEQLLYMTLTEVCPGTKNSYPTGHAPRLPWFAYTRLRGEEFHADNTNYARIPRYRVELLYKENDPDLVERFESALSSIGAWRLYESDDVDAEGCLLNDYRLSLDISKTREREANHG